MVNSPNNPIVDPRTGKNLAQSGADNMDIVATQEALDSTITISRRDLEPVLLEMATDKTGLISQEKYGQVKAKLDQMFKGA